MAASPPFSSGSLLPFLHLPGHFHRKGFPLTEPGLLPPLTRVLSFGSRHTLARGRQAPLAANHGFPGPPPAAAYPAARPAPPPAFPSQVPRTRARRLGALTQPSLFQLCGQRWPNLRTPTMAEAPEMFSYLCVGARADRISTWQRAIPAAHHSHWLRSLAVQSDHQ